MGKRQNKRLSEIQAKAASQPVKPDPWEIITYHGWRMSRYTAASIKVLEETLGYELSILQGPYHTSFSGSAGTHDLDGVIDLAPYRARRKCAVARRHSWAMWIRPYNWDGKGGGRHLHGCLLKAKPMADLAEWQRDVAYPNKWDGLVGNSADTFPVHPDLVRFNYDAWWHDHLLDQQIKGLTAYINRLLDKLSAARAERKRLQAKRDN